MEQNQSRVKSEGKSERERWASGGRNPPFFLFFLPLLFFLLFYLFTCLGFSEPKEQGRGEMVEVNQQEVGIILAG